MKTKFPQADDKDQEIACNRITRTLTDKLVATPLN